MPHGLDIEWEALLVTLFTLAVGSVGKPITGGRHARSSSQQPVTSYESQLEGRSIASESTLFAPKAWSWMQGSRCRYNRETPSSKSKQKRRAKSNSPRLTHMDMSDYETMARDFLQDISTEGMDWLTNPDTAEIRALCTTKVMLALHLFLEESRLNLSFEVHVNGSVTECLSAVVAQFGHYLGLESWNGKSYHDLMCDPDRWQLSSCKPSHLL